MTDEISVPPEVAKNYPRWNCELRPFDKERADTTLTVGVRSQMLCNGEAITPFKPDVKILFPDETLMYSLNILSVVASEASSAEFIVTSYKAGDFKPAYLVLSDGQSVAKVEGLKWTVQTVLKKEGEQEPYPGYGPFTLTLPWWFWAAWAVGVVILGAVVWRVVLRELDRRRFRKKLLDRRSSVTPLSQFYKDVRRIARAQTLDDSFARKIAELENALNEYLSLQFLVPVGVWSTRRALREIRRLHPKIYREVGSKLQKLLSELAKARKKSASVNAADWEQFSTMSREVVDKIYELKAGAP